MESLLTLQTAESCPRAVAECGEPNVVEIHTPAIQFLALASLSHNRSQTQKLIRTQGKRLAAVYAGPRSQLPKFSLHGIASGFLTSMALPFGITT